MPASISSSSTVIPNASAWLASTAPSTSEAAAAASRSESAALIWSICCWMSWSRGPPSWLCSSVTVARGLGDEDPPLNVEVRAVVRRAGDGRDRPEVRLPEAIPRGRAEDPQGERDGDRKGDDDQLLGSQLILPARAMSAVEDGSRSEAHRLMVMRRLGCGPRGRWAWRGAILADAPVRAWTPIAGHQPRAKVSRMAPQRSLRTRSIASRTMPPVIFEAPATRSRKTIGTWTMRAPRRCAHQVVSIWKP